VVGGMKVDEPASDLAMALSIASSYYEKPIPTDTAFIGEIGLSGEVRAVSQLSVRLNEAAKMGFRRVMIPKMRRRLTDVPDTIKVIEARNIGEAIAITVPKD
jgi:DNA repair protein RadA/Sms